MTASQNQNDENKTALILGATGGVGGEITRVLLARGWTIAALTRDPAKAATDRDPAIQWIKGDAMSASDVLHAAQGASLIVHAVNPAGYRDWDKLVVPWIDNTIAAARAVGARVVLPGTVYNYGPDAFPTLRETSPQNPVTRKGKLRAEMERRLKASGVPTLVVRAGDFFGGSNLGASSWFAQGIVKPGTALKSVTRPGRRGVGHAWAYLPDLAETVARLIETTPAEGFETYHFGGHYDPDGMAMIGATRRAVGRDLPVKAFPWWMVALASPFVVLFREMTEMRYLWTQSLRLDNAKLVKTLGAEPHTPLDVAVAKTLRDLKCS